jgi:hypothetical protein
LRGRGGREEEGVGRPTRAARPGTDGPGAPGFLDGATFLGGPARQLP